VTTLVMKFGGTSVGGADALSVAAAIVLEQAQRWEQLVVIVSAMSGVTDALTQGAFTAANGDESAFRAVASDLRVRHYRVVDELFCAAGDGETRNLLLATIDDYLDEFTVFCQSVFVLGELTPRALDAITSLGERINARLFAALLRRLGAPSEAVDATELIVTDGTFQNAVPLLESSRRRARERLLPLLAEGLIPVVTGFIGADQAGVTTTLGRGGSDFSAAVLGACLDAGEVWIWTDVDGVMTADPRLVPGALVIPSLSYGEVSELAYYGAKVLHPRAIRPVIEGGIPLWVKNTFNPAAPGTCIVRERENTPGTVKAVTAIHGLSMVTVEGRGMLGVPGIAARTFAAVASCGASVLMISQSSSEQSISFVIPTPAVPSVIAAVNREMALELARRDIDRVWSLDDVVIVTAVGAGMRTTPGVAARILGALGDGGVNVIAMAQGSSDCSVSLVIDAGAAADAVRLIHHRVIVANNHAARPRAAPGFGR